VIVRSVAGRQSTVLAWAVICGIVAFNLGWLVAGALQAGAYSAATDDVSDLDALTATDPWVMLTASGVAGLATILFALFALRPALGVAARGSAIGAWLLALSLMGLDNLSDVFFRLDCRAADAGCTMEVATSSGHATIHVAVAIVSAAATITAPFFLAHRMRRTAHWRDLARPAVAFGLVMAALLVAYAALERRTGGGYLQRAAIVWLSLGVVALAMRVRTLARGGAGEAQDDRT
jgi:Protein of unknown function (DUF998)